MNNPSSDNREKAVTTALDYHERTKHRIGRLADGPEVLDISNQPNPFRTYDGARLSLLDEVEPTAEPLYDGLYREAPAPASLDRSTLSQLFFDSLAISGWRKVGEERLALKVNPSCGNLHPTEGYLLTGPLKGISESPALFHYNAHFHALVRRREMDKEHWSDLLTSLPGSVGLVGLTSVIWREAWKYGERAFRYCELDVGHAIAAIAFACRALGWQVRLLEGVAHEPLKALLGVDDQRSVEAEYPECLLAMSVGDDIPAKTCAAFTVDPDLVDRIRATPLVGRAKPLSQEHREWPLLGRVARATEHSGSPDSDPWEPLAAPHTKQEESLVSTAVGARDVFRSRRSAVAMNDDASISREAFYRMLGKTLPESGNPVFRAFEWPPQIHLLVCAHRVERLDPGLYLLVRSPDAIESLKKNIGEMVVWKKPLECPEWLPLYTMVRGDFQRIVRTIACDQEVAGQGAFAASMLARFESALRWRGASFYRRLFWEAGAIGQTLHLEAGALGFRGSGMGCFLDDIVHELLRFRGRSYQNIYHFTVGAPMPDDQLETGPPYAHRKTMTRQVALRANRSSQTKKLSE
jgi:SagB-type dehydrogenase family enzyme